MTVLSRILSAEEYDDIVDAYAQASTPQQRSRLGDTLVTSARGLMWAAIHDRPNRFAGLDEHDLTTIVDDALMTVLHMADTYNQTKTPSFYKWLTSAKAPWRATIDEATVRMRYGDHFTRAERQALQVAQGLTTSYINEYGYPPDADTLQVLIADQVTARAYEKNRTVEDVQQANRKAGFTRAARILPTLIAQQHNQGLPEDDHEQSWTAAVSTIDSELQGIEDASSITAWAHLAGPVTSAAANRMRTPHAQWAHLAPETLLTIV